jgi:hypothetical protein
MLLMALSFAVCMFAFIVMGGFRPLSAMTLCFYIPILWLFIFGKVRHRLANTLPLFAVVTYVFLGFQYGMWDEATVIFFFVPYVGLTLKPKRAVTGYMSIALTTIYLVIRFTTGYEIPLTTRIMAIILIYVIFFPPMIRKKLDALKTRLIRA